MLKNVIEFYQANKDICHLVAYLLVSVISTILVLCLKKKKELNEMDLILVDVFEKLPNFIVAAEHFIDSGADKKASVLDAVQSYVKNKFSVILPKSYIGLIDFMIEEILKTPQKKIKKES